jgi:hypothetical protein
MKIKRVIVFSSGLAIGYLAGTAAGRERFEQIRSGAAAVASDLGLTRVSEHLRLRSAEVARASVDLAAETTCEGIDSTADRLEALLASSSSHGHGHPDSGLHPVPSKLAHSNGSHHSRHKGTKRE